MNGEISYLILNPTWNVPASIIREEIFQKVTEDSSYLLNHNFKVYLDTVEIDPMEVELSELSAEEVQYKIVQDPGDGNALGKIKFMFNNRFGVYLHDTPTRTPFNSSNRAVSHGCVRVETPLPLAEFLLKDHPKWNIDYLKIEIGQKVEDKSKISEYKKKRGALSKNSKDDKTTEIFLSKKVPLYIDYWTAWVDDNGEINFRDDVYSKDKILMENLFNQNQR
jgi:murein L,D-transpeptidase YcbB/YkuD